ncbi:MAG: 3-methyl-2-oxobutanoate hydroxymethyltransferase [Hydrogenobacter thermophilus]|uniref:3-methyl-2-oxobutanoate hydroxymethyltransferase n=1 Tax=Hydrogenobacter thermophilus TaxID=940 RepID=UPI001C786F99|nr:3-methyl-2-oxobutanoate hydroxymethyltransferase [Hydrogenobacter thermophilus]QWK20327.1 MAG: 3-methyl-2-oxobutanoate hydroxymethyltransferase [Hydrogenobacter thermophilus]
MPEGITIRHLFKKKKDGQKITMVSTYDYISAKLCDEVGIDCVLVGDSLGMVFQGHDSTLPVSLDEMIYHTKAVKRGIKRAFLIVDMPFMSYQVSLEEAIRNCGRVMKETGANAVKLEGGEELADLVYKLVNIGVPVVGHLGFTPQSVHALGGYRVVGKKEEEQERVKRSFKALEDAGAFMIVLESMPSSLAREITQASKSITIGIGAGPYCDGQVLVFHDLVGLVEDIKPRFVKRYVEGAKIFRDALRRYKEEVEKGIFPSEEESYG